MHTILKISIRGKSNCYPQYPVTFGTSSQEIFNDMFKVIAFSRMKNFKGIEKVKKS